MIETETLSSGLRIVADRRRGDVVYCGIAVDAGTRDELPEESGMAHFVEHMSFKGTAHRRAWHILNRMEVVGGELNAYTGKEATVYYCSTLRQHLNRALDLLFDIVIHSAYPQREIEKEVEVVVDEIESYNDSPSELIYDDFESILFKGHPLGRNILGDAERLRSYLTEDVRCFVERLYHPSRMVLFVYGDVPMSRIVKMAERLCPSVDTPMLPHERFAPCPTDIPPLSAIHRDTHQAHVIIGTTTCPMGDSRHTGLHLLNNILGGPGMNSRLNIALRERNGLVYTVESTLTSYTDTGVWNIYFGCDHQDVNRCRKLVERELQRLTDAPLSPAALSAAKRQLKGQVALSWENGENVAISMGRRYLLMNKTQTLQELCERIDAVDAQQLCDLARQMFAPSRLVTLIYP
ncbi:MAG: insulinase family protein [Bacteroidaceae bacterium]|nr:insulinase family protein [Bacteroidaceae bacterium]